MIKWLFSRITSMLVPTNKHSHTSSHDVKSGLVFLGEAAALSAYGRALLRVAPGKRRALGIGSTGRDAAFLGIAS